MMRKRNSTIHDIAGRLNVAASTVSRILNANGHAIPYAKATIKRVHAAAADLNYVPNAVAGNLRRGSTKLIGLILPWNTPELMDGIERWAEELGFGVLVQFTPSPDAAMELRSLRTALEHQVDGIIWMPGNLDQENADCVSVMESLSRMRKPIVLLESAMAQLPTAPVIDFDYPSAFREALVHLTTQGYRRVDFIHLAGVASAQSIRGQQFVAQAQALKMPSEIVALADPKNLKAEFLRRQAQKGPQALLFENDWLGIQALQAARDLQVAVPREIGVGVVGDLLLGNALRVGELPSPGLTAIRRPFSDMARRAVEILVATINREPVVVPEPLLPMSFIPRQSTLLKGA